MMSKKGLLKFVKYTLIFSNAFGFILSIFLGLFGIAYPDKHFPLSYKGREMALCSLFCMLFTTIGYCGAQNHRRILLIIYGATNVIIVIIVVILWFLFRENSILGNKEISNMFITTLAITIAVMFLFAFILAFHIKTFKEDTQDSIVSQSHQLLQQTTAFLQQQQQQQQHQASLLGAGGALSAATASLHHGQQQPAAHQHPHAQHPNPLSHMGSDPLPHPHPAYMPTSAPISMGAGGHYHLGMAGGQAAHRQQHDRMSMRANPMQQQHLDEAGSGFQLMMPPPPPPVKLHAHLKSSISSSASRNKKALQPMMLPGQPAPPSMPPASGAASSHQMGLMRNQSSPLPGVHQQVVQQQQQQASSSVRSSQSKQAVTSNHQQHYSQSQKSLRGGQQQQQQQIQRQQQASPPSPQHHQPSGRPGDRSMGPNQRIPAACPVQYCAFDCDQTV